MLTTHTKHSTTTSSSTTYAHARTVCTRSDNRVIDRRATRAAGQMSLGEQETEMLATVDYATRPRQHGASTQPVETHFVDSSQRRSKCHHAAAVAAALCSLWVQPKAAQADQNPVIMCVGHIFLELLPNGVAGTGDGIWQKCWEYIFKHLFVFYFNLLLF